MADETMQAGEETSWWAFDAFADSELPSTSFDEPLEWPETLDWGDVGDPGAGLRFPESYDPRAFELPEPIFPLAFEAGPHPAPAADPLPAIGELVDGEEVTLAHATPLAVLGGAPAPAYAGSQEHIPDSIWAAEGPATGAGAGAATTVTAELDRERPGGWRRFDLRHGNAAVIALISFASLVLLGMFLSVRARNDVPTDTSRTRTTSDQIAVQGTLNTVPLTIPNNTSPPSTINIAGLLPPADATAGAESSGAGASTGAGGTTATTAPRAAATATTAPAPATNTTAAPPTTQAPPPTTAAPDTTVTTQTQPTTPTSITFPSVPTIPGNTAPTLPDIGWRGSNR